MLTRRVPLWSALLLALLVAGALTVALVIALQSSVKLGPAVGSAQRIEIQMNVCNRDVDRLDFNPRHEELRLEKVLREEGARAADVTVERSDCPRPR